MKFSATTGDPCDRAPAPAGPGGATVNDVHSQLNRTRVARIVMPESVRALQEIVHDASEDGLAIAVAGGRHAMGGQQFARGGVLVDMCAMSRIDHLDVDRGVVTVGAGIDWVRLVNHLLWAGAGDSHPWSIIQKQTGADRMTIGGAPICPRSWQPSGTTRVATG